MWPQDPNGYNLIKSILVHPENEWRPLTYWQTDLKNLHFTYQLLKYAKDPSFEVGKKWYDRSRKKYTEYGLLNSAGRPTRLGSKFLKHVEQRLAENPEFFDKNVNPFELEYLFHKILNEAGSLEVFDNLQSLLKAVPTINVDDAAAIVSVVRINNGDETLKKYNDLDKTSKEKLAQELTDIQKELESVGGLLKAKAITTPEWLPYLKLISVGALGQQGDGYYRAASLLRAHILLLTLLKVKAGGEFIFDDLYTPFQNNISKDSFIELLKEEPGIENKDGIYSYAPEKIASDKLAENDQSYTEEIKTEIQKIRYATLNLTDEERLEKIKAQLKAAEQSPVITVPEGHGRQRTTRVRHVRDPKTSAAMRLYFKDICQLCGFDGKKDYGIGIAEVDHAIDEISVRQNNRPSNLIVLCPNCHEAKSKGVIKFINHADHFIAKNTFNGNEQRIDKPRF